jgi:hypothetical protein
MEQFDKPYAGKPYVSAGEAHREMALQFVGQWVQCHTVYGVHEGILYKALRRGIIIVNATQLASANQSSTDASIGTYRPNEDELDIQHVQFFPGFGMFLPYPAIYGIVPRPFFFI